MVGSYSCCVCDWPQDLHPLAIYFIGNSHNYGFRIVVKMSNRMQSHVVHLEYILEAQYIFISFCLNLSPLKLTFLSGHCGGP